MRNRLEFSVFCLHNLFLMHLADTYHKVITVYFIQIHIRSIDQMEDFIILLSIKPKIHNVVCTANLKQKVNITKLVKMPCGIYDEAIYGGRCGYIKTPEMDSRVTIFLSGKMISISGKSIQKAIQQLNHAKFYLVQKKMITNIKIEPMVRNIVAIIMLEKKIPIDKLSSKISGAIYDPETFPGMILKGLNSYSFLIFSSGKIVITGSKSKEELNSNAFELIQRLNEVR